MFNRDFEAVEDNIIFLFAHLTVKNINFALISLKCLLERGDIDQDLYLDEYTYYFFHIQSLLTACGNISNVFYYGFNNRTTRERHLLLQEHIGITRGQFPLIFQKEARNTNEHFDERFDTFRGQLGDYNLLERNTPQYMRDSIMNSLHLRTFDHTAGIYYTYDRQLRPICYKLHELRAQLLGMRERIATRPIFESGWLDHMPGDLVE